jgi:hypothetical protein
LRNASSTAVAIVSGSLAVACAKAVVTQHNTIAALTIVLKGFGPLRIMFSLFGGSNGRDVPAEWRSI